MDSVGENTAEEKRLSKLDDEEKHREHREMAEDRLLETFYVQVKRCCCGCCSLIARSGEAGIIYRIISAAFEPGEEMLFVDSMSPCNVCTRARPKLFYNHLV